MTLSLVYEKYLQFLLVRISEQYHCN